MDKLKVRTETVKFIDCSDLEEFTKEVYGHRFDAAASQEWNRDSYHSKRAEARELASWDQEKIDQLMNGEEPEFALEAVLNDLVNKGLLEPGDYYFNSY